MFVFLFSLLISLCCFWFGFKMIRLYLKVKRWSRAEATVLSKSVQLNEKSSSGKYHYLVKVEYQYVFNNQSYTNDKLYLAELMGGWSGYRKSAAEKISNELDDRLKIYVNPQQPDQSVVYCKGIGLYVIMIAMGILSLLMGLSALV